jgi:hypothetical protein
LAIVARLIRQMPGNGDVCGMESAHACAATLHSAARPTSAIDRHASITLQYTAPV